MSVIGMGIFGTGEMFKDSLAERSAISLLGILQWDGIQQKITFLLELRSI